ncbi:transient receptor potential cation channel subfamily M member-like 2 [Procambarus clarkii]|uniref:transient receptor potential cation channel subfamily M member-like 2 n=1 Tax=Procambarus clarkii TaxID=6728 RepID=UPI0037435BDC
MGSWERSMSTHLTVDLSLPPVDDHNTGDQSTTTRTDTEPWDEISIRKISPEQERPSKDEQTDDYPAFVLKHFCRKECIRFMGTNNVEKDGPCCCGLMMTKHQATLIPASQAPSPHVGPDPQESTSEGPGSCPAHLTSLPTNAYGSLTFLNEKSGAREPAPYIRMAADTPMKSVLTLLSDYWKVLDPKPELVISVVGDARSLQLDGRKKETFTSGLIKAVKSTGAVVMTGGLHAGIMRCVGDALNKAQLIVKREEGERQGARCLGVAAWGHTDQTHSLINKDINTPACVRYRVKEKVVLEAPLSLNRDHTHFLLVDDGHRNRFEGIDDFRSLLEGALCEAEVPVVVVVAGGELRHIRRCFRTLEQDIPIVVVRALAPLLTSLPLLSP